MKRSQVIGVALLCLLSGSGWILLQIYPREIEFPVVGCIHFVVIGLVAAAYCLVRRTGFPKGSVTVGIALSGMGLVAAPALALGVSAGAVSEFSGVALLCSIPLLTVLLLGAFEWTGVRGVGPGALLTSVLGMGGALLVFPAQFPASVKGWLFFSLIAACCVLVAFSGIKMHGLIQGVAISPTVALSAFSCAALLGGYGLLSDWPQLSLRAVAFECVRCLVFDLPLMWLIVWLIREVDPGRLSARFLLVPLVTAIEGYAVMGGGIQLEAAAGMVLLAASGVILIRSESPVGEGDVSSLHLR